MRYVQTGQDTCEHGGRRLRHTTKLPEVFLDECENCGQYWLPSGDAADLKTALRYLVDMGALP
jgi:hypothetical protein